MGVLIFRFVFFASLVLMVVSGGAEPVFAQDVPTDTSIETTAPEKQETPPPAKETTPPAKETTSPSKETTP